MASTVEEEKRHAFTVKLGLQVSAGRQSQIDSIQNVKVTNQTLVSYFFELGAFLFRSIHGRDRAQLEKDYDVCLIKKTCELILHPKREISHYYIGKDDILELRHKALPIMLTVNLWEGQEKSIKVYSGAPVMDIIPVVCKDLGIEEDAEMALAYPVIKVKDHTPSLRWLDPSASLSSQEVIDGDTLLLRKKFFILNDDINEALERNTTLKELLYQQAYHHFLSESCHMYNKELHFIQSQFSILFNHIESNGEDDTSGSMEVMSKLLLAADQSMEQITETCRLQQSVKSMPKGTAKTAVLQLMSEPSAIVLSYFPVRMQDSSEERVMAVSSDTVSVCEVNEIGQLKIIPEQSWRLKDVRESCQQTEHAIRINTLGYWHELFTDYATELSNYIAESERISRRKAMKQRSSTCMPSPEPPLAQSELPILTENPVDEDTARTSNPNNSAIPHGVSSTISHTKTEPSLQNHCDENAGPVDNHELVSKDQKQKTDVEMIHKSSTTLNRQSIVASGSISMDAASNGSNSLEVLSRGSLSLEIAASGSSSIDIENPLTGSAAEKASTTAAVLPNANVKCTRDSTSSNMETTTEWLGAIAHSTQLSANLQKSTSARISDLDMMYQWHSVEEKPPSTPQHRRPFNVIYTPTKSEKSTTKQHSRQGSKVSRTDSVRSKSSQKSQKSFTESIFIPQYLSLDYRVVVERHRLFHIVVLKQDIRPLLLDITTPVKDSIDVICGTFGISNSENYYLAIPPGVQSIVEKYGGRPKSWVGRFKKSEHSIKTFSSRLDCTKTLQTQYDYSIQPYLLHLRKYQMDDEDIDAPDTGFGCCGEEWPKTEHPDVARYRKFYQGWIGVVQGAYPVTKDTAVQLAAYLTAIYFTKKAGRPWPPRDYDPKIFLPERHRNVSGIDLEVAKAYSTIEDTQVLGCINTVIDMCSIQQGVFFEIAIPTKGDMIPTKRMKKILFGINQHCLFTVEKEAGVIILKRDHAQIHEWACSDNSFHLDFKTWGDPLYGYTYQTKEVIDTLEMFLDVSKRRRIMEDFELERTRDELMRLGHLDEEKKIDLSHVSSIETHTGEKTTLNESNQIVDETNKDPFRTEPVVLISANDGPNNKRISTLSTLSPLSLDLELKLLTPLHV